MTAKEFWNSQVPTDANKVYVSDFYASKFGHEDLARFAEAFCNAEIERRIKEWLPEQLTIEMEAEDYSSKEDANKKQYYDGNEFDAFVAGCKWYRSRLTENKQEGGDK